MWRTGSSFLFAAALIVLTAARASAGAFMLPEGQGQLIAGVGYVASSRRFDAAGTAMPAQAYRKAAVSGYLEYGVAPWFSLVAAPTLARQNGSVAENTVTGSDSSAIGGRLRLFGWGSGSWGSGLIAFQALVQPPIGNGSSEGRIADGGTRSFAIDLRVPVGWSFRLFGLSGFFDVQPGVRVRADPLPDEARLDLAFGFRPIAQLMVLVQDFSAFAHSSGPLIPRSSYSKVQASLVYDLSLRWSVQLGAFRTIAGRNALRETGPLAALWCRF